MSIFDSLKKNVKPHMLFKARIPRRGEYDAYLGRTVIIPPHELNDKTGPVKITEICGSRVHPKFYEINGKYLIGMLRFHAQMLRDKSITEEQFKDFEEMDMHVEYAPSSTDDKKVKDVASETA